MAAKLFQKVSIHFNLVVLPIQIFGETLSWNRVVRIVLTILARYLPITALCMVVIDRLQPPRKSKSALVWNFDSWSKCNCFMISSIFELSNSETKWKRSLPLGNQGTDASRWLTWKHGAVCSWMNLQQLQGNWFVTRHLVQSETNNILWLDERGDLFLNLGTYPTLRTQQIACLSSKVSLLSLF